ncbi:MAG: cytochrome c biogenesis protein CcsA, partial [Candidatus Hydrogenedentes bacterium]|nr:cytochrome c biogenesis protein CcsA [Candidatus Hydrogenedentota bacterium]
LQAEIIAHLEALADARDNRGAFLERARQFHQTVTAMAAARGEYGKIPLEVVFYRAQFFYYALVLYILAFLLIAVQWLRPPKSGAGLLRAANLGLVALPTVLLIAGIVMRSIIRGRPPVTTLYETILFCTAVAAAVSLFIEFMNRQRIALAVGALLGVAGMFLANKYEVSEGADTMPSMVAVLDTNFWLATHVTTIAIGYGAGLLASAMAHVYVFGRLVGRIGRIGRIGPIEREERQRGLARTVYGVLCFSLLFSVLGTVLGGIWANESWGRFWGWDPKENGALMIVLWQLAILHARRGGLIGDLGVNLGVIAGGLVIAFSWFGVNLLGVGLHSYGFTSGTFAALAAFYAIEAVVIAAGATTRERAS